MRPVTIIIPDDKIKIIGILHFVHGMQEHRKRYAHVLEYFSNAGYICAISDMRGHGENITTKDDLGYFSRRGASALVEDTASFNDYLKKVYPGLPIIMVGHSMGSLIVRAFIKKRSSEINGLIICGSPSAKPFLIASRFIINVLGFLRGWRYRSNFVTNAVLSSFNKPFAKEGQKNAWLTRDGDIVDNFNRDPLCGVPFTLNGYKALINLLITVYSNEGWKRVYRNLPIMFISGGDDPCRLSDKKWQNSVNHLKSVGFHSIYSKMYPGMRHELFNEIGKEEVFKDILKFLEINLKLEPNIYQ